MVLWNQVRISNGFRDIQRRMQCWNWPKRTGVSCRNVWNFAQGLTFKADFYSTMGVCRHKMGAGFNPLTIPTLVECNAMVDMTLIVDTTSKQMSRSFILVPFDF